MSELISEEKICRIEVETTDKDDYLLEAESNAELSGIISPEDSNGAKDASEECESRRVLKRKSTEEEGNHPSTSHWGEVLNISSAPQMSTVKRFKIGGEAATVGVISLEKHGLNENFFTLSEPQILSASRSSLENEETINEISDKTGLSKSYLLNTIAVRLLAENFMKNHSVTNECNTSKQGETKLSKKKEPIPIISSEIIRCFYKNENVTTGSSSESSERVSKACSDSVPEMSSIAEPSFVQNSNLTKGSSLAEQEENAVCSTMESSGTIPKAPEMSSDAEPKMSITSKQSETQSKLEGNGKYETLGPPPATPQIANPSQINPLRAFRIYKSKNPTTSVETSSEVSTVVKKLNIQHSSDACSFDICPTLRPQEQIQLFKPYKQETIPSTPPVDKNRQTVLSQHITLPIAQDIRYNSQEPIPDTFFLIPSQKPSSEPQQVWQIEPSRTTLEVDSTSSTIECENAISSPEHSRRTPPHGDRCDICHHMKLVEHSGDNPSVISFQRPLLDPQQVWQTSGIEHVREGYSQNEKPTASPEQANPHNDRCAFCQHLESGEYDPDKCSSLQNKSSVSQQLWQAKTTEPSRTTMEPDARSNILQLKASEAFPEYSKQSSVQVIHNDRCAFCQHLELDVHSATSIQRSSSAPQQPCQTSIIHPYTVLEQDASSTILQHAGYAHNESCTFCQHLELKDHSSHKPTQTIETSNTTLEHDARSTLLQHAAYRQNENSKAPPKHSNQTSVQIPYNDIYTIPQKIQLEQPGSDRHFTYLQKTTPYLEQFGQKIGTENAPILQQHRDENNQDKPTISQQEIWIKKTPGQHTILQIGHCPNMVSLQHQPPQELNQNSSKQVITAHPQQFGQRESTETSHTFLKIPNNYRYIILEQPQFIKMIENQLHSIPCQGIWIRGGTEISQPRSLLSVIQQNNTPCQQNVRAVHCQPTSLVTPQTGITFNQVQLASRQNCQQQHKPSSQEIWEKKSFERSQNKSPEIIQLDESSNSSLEEVEDAFHIDWEKGIIENFRYTSLQIFQKQHTRPWRKSPEIIELDESSHSSIDEVENSFNIDWEKGIIENSQHTSLQTVEQQQNKPSSQDVSEKENTDHSQNESLEIIQIDESSKSSESSIEGVEDALNVQLAAEALNLLKTNSERTSKIPIEVVTPELPAAPIVSDSTSCSVSNKCNKTEELIFDDDTSLQNSSKAETESSDLPKSQAKNRALLDPSLEVRDVVTGVKIPFELLGLKNIKITEIEAIDSGFTTENLETHSDTYMQLSDSVSCVKVVAQQTTPPRVEETTIKHNEPRYSDATEAEKDKLIQTLNIAKCVKYPLEAVSLPRNEEITFENIQAEYTALEVAENPTKHVLSKKNLQLSDGNICVHVPLQAIGLPNEINDSGFSSPKQIDVGITKSHIISNSLLKFPYRPSSIVVKIPLDAIFLPKNAETGVKIPLEAPCWPRNNVVAKETLTLPKTSEPATKPNRKDGNSMRKLQQENRKIIKPIQSHKTAKKTGKPSSPKYEIMKKNENLSKIKKLPLVPRLRSARTAHIKELNEIRRCHLPAGNLDSKPIVTPPKLLKNEDSNDDTHKTPISSPKLSKPMLPPPKLVVNESSNMHITEQQPVDKSEKINVLPLIPANRFKIPLLPSVSDSKLSPSVAHPSNATKRIPQEVKPNKQQQNPRVIASGMFKKEMIKRETTPNAAQQQLEESTKPGPSKAASRVSVITKWEFSSLQPGVENNGNLKKDENTSENVENAGSTDPLNTPNPLADEVKDIKSPMEAFRLLINDDMIRRILKHTNVRIIKLSHMSRSRRNCFKYAATENELKAFLGLLLISGALRHNQTPIPEVWSECFGAGIYRATLQEQRFQILSQCICLGDNTCRDKCTIRDEFTRIGDLWEEYLNNCKKYSILCLPSKTNEKTDNTTNDETESNEDTHIYSTARKTVNTALRILFSMLDGAAVRGLAMFKRVNPTIYMCQREFLKQVGMSLVRAHLRSRLMKPSLRRKERELIDTILNRKCDNDQSIKSPSPPTVNCLKKPNRCQLCPWNEYRKTKYECECCQRAMCKEHRTDLCVECIKELM